MLDSESATSFKETLVMAMFNTLMGLDANDPPKTLATMQFYCSVFSSVSLLPNEKPFRDLLYWLASLKFLDGSFCIGGNQDLTD